MLENTVAITGGSPLVAPVVEGTANPLENLPGSSCSRDWLLSSGEKSGSVKQVRKFKRLRKLGDTDRKTMAEDNEEKSSNPRSPRRINLDEGKLNT